MPGRETTVEVLTDNKGLGLFFVGGKDTLIGVSENKSIIRLFFVCKILYPLKA